MRYCVPRRRQNPLENLRRGGEGRKECAYLAECLNLIHKRQQTPWHPPLPIVKLPRVKIKLLNPIELARLALPAHLPLPPREYPARRVPEQTLFIGVGDAGVRVLREGELAVQLREGDAVVGEIEEAVFFDGLLGEGDEVAYGVRVRGVEEGEVDCVQGCPVEGFGGGWRGDPFRDGGLAFRGWGIEGCCHVSFERFCFV